MIALVLAMVWSRRGQAVTVALLTMLGVAAAVAAPAYLRAADRAVAAAQVAAAPAAERSVTLTERVADAREVTVRPPVSLEDTRSALGDLPGFEYVSASEYPTVGLEADPVQRTMLVYRQNVCAHLVIVTGRCLAGEGEMVIGDRTARRLGVRPGDSLSLAYAEFEAKAEPPGYYPRGAAKPLLVAGTYSVPAPADVYWGTSGYFTTYAGRPDEPAFVLVPTVTVMDHGLITLTIDGVAAPGALTAERLPEVRAGLAALTTQVTTLGSPVELDTGVPALLTRIDRGRTAAHQIVPVVAVALVLLACLTIFLAVGYGTEGRRPELAIVALCGARLGSRWWLATGENLVAIVAGAVLGCIAGQLLVNLMAAVRFPGVGSDPGVASLRYAPWAALAAVLTAVAAERRQLLTPVSELLRRAPARAGRAGAIVLQILITVLAAAAGAQLFVTGGTLTGIGTFAAALIAVALAQLAARAVLPVVTRFAARALRRGRPGAALAGFQLSRRPGAARLFTLLAAAVAIAGYASCAVDTAARGRSVEAGLGTGADRVVAVKPIGRQALLSAVRKADPDGAYAMAAVRLPVQKGQPVALAVDTTRLAAVATWPGDDRSRAAALRPPAPDPPVVPGPDIALDLTTSGLNPTKPVLVSMVLGSPGGDAGIRLGELRPGRHTYAQRVETCTPSCRINVVRFSAEDGQGDVAGRVTLNVPGATGWRDATDGGTLDLAVLNRGTEDLFAQPADTPDPLPAAVAGPVPDVVTGLDARPIPVRPALRLPAIPGAGTPATMIDLDYADRLCADGNPSGGAEVWLSPRAPADAVARLEAAGLVITGDTRASSVRAALDRQGPALALEFAAVIAVLAAALAAGALVLAATVDRPRRVEDLAALRAQGLSRRARRQAALGAYPALVAAAVPAGLAAALLTWWLTGWALPLAGLDPPPLPLPGWPHAWLPIALAGALFVVLASAAWLAGRRTLRAVP